MALKRLIDQARTLVDRLLFRIRGIEPAPIVLGQRRIFVLPTRSGLSYMLALLVMLIASINYNLSLGYALVFLLGGVAVVSIVHAFRNLLQLSIAPGRAEPVFAGESAHFRLLVSNDRKRRRPALSFVARDALSPESFDVAPLDTHQHTLRRPTSRRGWLALGRVVLQTTYPLGLIRAWSILVPDTRCLVYPAPETAPPPLPANASAGLGRRKGEAGDDDFAGLRTHDLADSPRHVAWKVVARDGPMLTKRFSGLEGSELVLDWATLPTSLDVERRLSRLCAWVLAADSQGRPFSLLLPGSRIDASSGSQHVQACLTRLALYRENAHAPE